MTSTLEATKTPDTLGIHGVLLQDRKDAFGFAASCLHEFLNPEYSATSTTRQLMYGNDRDTFNDKANELLEVRRKETYEVASRPVLLLDHSMGRLLIEQSLIDADNKPIGRVLHALE